MPGSRKRAHRCGSFALGVALLLTGSVLDVSAAASRGRLRVEELTFVASLGSTTRFLLRAESARIGSEASVVELERVELELPASAAFAGLTLQADRGRIQLDSSDFRLEGDLVARLANGRELRLAWVGYDAARALLYSDARITIDEPSAHYRAGGLRYWLDRGQLRLLGGVEVVRGH